LKSSAFIGGSPLNEVRLEAFDNLDACECAKNQGFVAGAG
jgi:hypothetical protein